MINFLQILSSVEGSYREGDAGIDFPAYTQIPPRLAFTCQNQIPGYYAGKQLSTKKSCVEFYKSRFSYQILKHSVRFGIGVFLMAKNSGPFFSILTIA